jgi:hypothetical protein
MNVAITKAYAVSSTFTILILLPLIWRRGDDSYPLSHYPMFAVGRTQPVLAVDHVLGVAADGTRSPVPPSVTANGITMQAAQSIARAIARGEAESFCRHTARRAKKAGLAVVALEVATSHYHVVRYFTTGTTPLERRVHARCAVESEGGAQP